MPFAPIIGKFRRRSRFGTLALLFFSGLILAVQPSITPLVGAQPATLLLDSTTWSGGPTVCEFASNPTDPNAGTVTISGAVAPRIYSIGQGPHCLSPAYDTGLTTHPAPSSMTPILQGWSSWEPTLNPPTYQAYLNSLSSYGTFAQGTWHFYLRTGVGMFTPPGVSGHWLIVVFRCPYPSISQGSTNGCSNLFGIDDSTNRWTCMSYGPCTNTPALTTYDIPVQAPSFTLSNEVLLVNYYMHVTAGGSGALMTFYLAGLNQSPLNRPRIETPPFAPTYTSSSSCGCTLTETQPLLSTVTETTTTGVQTVTESTTVGSVTVTETATSTVTSGSNTVTVTITVPGGTAATHTVTITTWDTEITSSTTIRSNLLTTTQTVETPTTITVTVVEPERSTTTWLSVTTLSSTYLVTTRNSTVTYVETVNSAQTFTSTTLIPHTSTITIIQEGGATITQTFTSSSTIVIVISSHLTTLSSTRTITISTSTTKTAAPAPLCIIATAAYGTELAGPVQFLRNFRDNEVQKTVLGAYFMAAFNHWYYSWAPTIAQYIAPNENYKAATRVLIAPLIGSLYLGNMAFTALAPVSPELAILATGLVTSAILGLTYLAAPYALALKLSKRRITKRTIYSSVFVAASLTSLATLTTGTFNAAAILASLVVVETLLLTPTLTLKEITSKIHRIRAN